MIPAQFSFIATHIWQSTLFAIVASLLTLVLKRKPACVRYAIWLAASYKFLVPFSCLISIGALFERQSPPPVVPQAISTLTQVVATPVFLAPVIPATITPAHFLSLASAIWLVWACGFAIVAASWARDWLRIWKRVRAASPLKLDLPIRVVSIASRLEPGVFGILRPVLLLPGDIADRLTPTQLQEVIAHELCHVKRRDNLAAAIHMLVEAIFWFHPLVWWLNARIVDEREIACDEQVLLMGSEPATYVETILAVCKSYAESPIACMSGISGSDLKKRIARIMARSFGNRLSLPGKVLLGIISAAAIAGPVAFGVVVPPVRTFALASVKPHRGGPAVRLLLSRQGLVAINVTARMLIAFAYNYKQPGMQMNDEQISGGPDWMNSDSFDIEAKVGSSTGTPAKSLGMLSVGEMDARVDQMRLMTQSLLAERFKLRIARDVRELPAYTLALGKDGPKFRPVAAPDPIPPGAAARPASENPGVWLTGPGKMQVNSSRLDLFEGVLGNMPDLGHRLVLDETGLKGYYAFTLQWTPANPAAPSEPKDDDAGGAGASGSSLAQAIQDQLGLKLESTTARAETIVVEHIERPSED
jgi:bla regulator protein BlaR1